MTVSLSRAWEIAGRLDEAVNAAADRAMQAAVWHTETAVEDEEGAS